MLHLHSAEGVEPLVAGLADILADPLPDPMQSEWLATPSQGLGRWLRIELSRRLGTSSGRQDGIAANLQVGFPGSLLSTLVQAGRAGDVPWPAEPWAIDRMVWAVLAVLDENRGDPRLGPVAMIPKGGTAFGQARRLADLLDRYGTHRPRMLRAWAEKNDVDGAGNPLSAATQWQAELFRLVRTTIDVPSPAELLPALLEQARRGALAVDLPPRLSLFGLTSIPGGSVFIDLVTAISAHRDVHLFLVNPSTGLASRARNEVLARPNCFGVLRGERSARSGIGHPLLDSWALPNIEANVLWSQIESSTGIPIAPVRSWSAPPRTILSQVQADLRADTPPQHLLDPDPGDCSIEIHSCHGPTRQVEVLRDALLHRLADDHTLREDQILVVCPDITTYAPLVESVFGPSAEFAGRKEVVNGTPLLSYRVTDRSLLETHGVLGALSLLINLIGSRFTASSVIDFIAQPPVRERYGFTDDEIDSISEWVAQADIRWGIDGRHRGRWGIPQEYEPGSWRAALDRMLLGITTSDDQVSLGVGEVLPLEIEGSDISTVGRFADLVGRIAGLAELAATPQPIRSWCELLGEVGDELFLAPEDAAWQRGALHRLLQDTIEFSTLGGQDSPVELELADVSRLFGDVLAGSPKRSDFFRGGITVSSLTPLRGIPYRVIAVLGMDDGAFGATGNDGDDLVAAAPYLGDRDSRSDTRQALLETVLAAGEKLLITHNGRSVITNQPVPPAVPLAELVETVLATVTEASQESVRKQMTVVHPRQSFDGRNFEPGGLHPKSPWSFDPSAHEGAIARSTEREDARPFLETPLEPEDTSIINLADLHRVLAHPVKEFLIRRLGVYLPRDGDQGGDDLPINLHSLGKWGVGTRLLDNLLDGQDVGTWQRRERASGSLPPGDLGEAAVAEVSTTVLDLISAAESIGYKPGAGTSHPIDIVLDDGTRVVGAVTDDGAQRPGPVQVSFSRYKAKHRLQAWVDLMALVAQDPSTDWQSVTINPTGKVGKPTTVNVLVPVGEDSQERRSAARAALTVAVDCYRRALTEPIPLFTQTSACLADEKDASREWRGFDVPGDGDDAHNQLVFGDISYPDLISIPAEPLDPPGLSPGRAKRFADHLWGAIEDSLIDLDAAEASK